MEIKRKKNFYKLFKLLMSKAIRASASIPSCNGKYVPGGFGSRDLLEALSLDFLPVSAWSCIGFLGCVGKAVALLGELFIFCCQLNRGNLLKRFTELFVC